MDIDMRKARVKSLKRILNNLSIEIKELNTRGFSDTEDLELAKDSINRFCEKLWPISAGSVRHMHDSRTVHNHQHKHPPRRTATV